MNDRITLKVNGVSRDLVCDSRTPLVYLLRNDFGLMGGTDDCILVG